MVSPKAPTRKAPDAELDVIPMKKVSPVAWIGVGCAALMVIGLVVFMRSGGSRDRARIEELRAKAEQPAASAKSPEELRAQRDHLAMTQRALEAAEQKQKEEEARQAEKQEDADKPAATSPTAPAPTSVTRPTNAQPAPTTKSALDAIESEALKGLE